MKDRILILDFMNFIYRGAITFGKPMAAEGQEDYTIVYNFFRNLRALVERLEPTKCFVALEGNPTFRKELFPDYKKNRLVKTGSAKEQSKNNILRQAEIVSQLIKFLPITQVRAEAFEADDTIYTLAHNLKTEEVIIVSTDSDLIQAIQHLHQHQIQLFHPGKKEFIIAPDYTYLVWKSCAGDKSDNIPSLMSNKKALALAQQPEDLKTYLDDEEHRANFSLNKQLIELQLIPDNQLEFIEYGVNYDQLFVEFEKMQLPSLLKEDYRHRFVDTFNAIS